MVAAEWAGLKHGSNQNVRTSESPIGDSSKQSATATRNVAATWSQSPSGGRRWGPGRHRGLVTAGERFLLLDDRILDDLLRDDLPLDDLDLDDRIRDDLLLDGRILDLDRPPPRY